MVSILKDATTAKDRKNSCRTGNEYHISTFRIFFPRVDLHVEEKIPASDGIRKVRPGTTILLVDDNEPVRKALSSLLETSGFEVLQATDGMEAIEILEKHRGDLDLLVTDVVMPQISGIELARRLEEERLP